MYGSSFVQSGQILKYQGVELLSFRKLLLYMSHWFAVNVRNTCRHLYHSDDPCRAGFQVKLWISSMVWQLLGEQIQWVSHILQTTADNPHHWNHFGSFWWYCQHVVYKHAAKDATGSAAEWNFNMDLVSGRGNTCNGCQLLQLQPAKA